MGRVCVFPRRVQKKEKHRAYLPTVWYFLPMILEPQKVDARKSFELLLFNMYPCLEFEFQGRQFLIWGTVDMEKSLPSTTEKFEFMQR